MQEPRREKHASSSSPRQDGLREVPAGLDEVKTTLEQAVTTLEDLAKNLHPDLGQELPGVLIRTLLSPLQSQVAALDRLLVALASARAIEPNGEHS
jgi:hypothetical protein